VFVSSGRIILNARRHYNPRHHLPGQPRPFLFSTACCGMSVVATLCDLRTLIVPSALSARTTGTPALSRILRQSPAFCPPGKTSGLSGIVHRELWGARQARLCNRLTCRKQCLELIKFAFTPPSFARLFHFSDAGLVGYNCLNAERKSSNHHRYHTRMA